ncbi:AAA family ATPase [Pseudomonas entomophila]|uniref:AAA family ATPase n=1 Tax=Pseudomonas entomophila TaxID=312306 RepID=UPI0015E327C1|nr:AAA family ATPase [Pseudomonas entomophila]MBA1193683.1 AAA family ATPase [Pseudomonas entomophila]
MEKSCAATILSMMKDNSNLASDQRFVDEFNQFEFDERRRLADGSFQLASAQRKAVLMALSHRFSLITGGAGVGKTIALRALVTLLENDGKTVYQLALSARAASQMAESSGRPAMTIAAYLHRRNNSAADQNLVLIIGEASMVDVLTFYQITHGLPPGASLVLMGDPHQLPPIGQA